ncbi:hypothetical protein AWC15_06330 [Mycobacterium lacus]|uniref:Uncharacterized protein n=1 Tax=Mycobacterium lacus TaxID=169765 RepID=A0A1X1XV54_9MYCO|nr:hypothetical protein AWC15_06330 [Mycobacterium lacus]BBX94935.1 hypothetical protein MLAC_02290 [Mycobacterium lacus]
MWGTLGQLGATAIFLVLATDYMYGDNSLFRWALLAASALTASNVVLTLVISQRRASAKRF